MTQNNIVLVKNSWALVTQLEMEVVGGLFYNRLFEIMPSVKPMFSRTAMPEQSKKLLVMFVCLSVCQIVAVCALKLCQCCSAHTIVINVYKC